ncbi:hypothetical protein RFI_40409, partial [Reticulomyxa filosa]
MQVYEKGVKELQVQLTTYWDYITVEGFKHKFPDLMDDWSCNVVNRLMNLKTILPNSYCEMSLVVDHKDHCIYLGLCKTLDYVLVRVILNQMVQILMETKNDSDSNESMKHLYCSNNNPLREGN